MTVPVSEVNKSIEISRFDAHAAALPPTLKKPFEIYRFGAKRMMDVALVLLSAPIVLPIIGLLALIIAASGRPVFYSQTRVGKGGRLFRLYKLRTMVPNADEALAEHIARFPEARKEWEQTQKLKDDPRVTPFGRLLRQSSLDEFPQFLNVLKGDMSLVGPRPMMESQVALYPGSAYYRLKPGVTGFWQISDRNQCDFADRARFDEAYERSMSLGTDLRVLFRTVLVVLRCTGY